MKPNTYFISERDSLQERIKQAEEIAQLNSKLQKFNWIFTHPHLFVVESKLLKRLADQDITTQYQITEIFARSFFDFRVTCIVIEGDFYRCPYINPYTRLIDQSVMLAVQKDYAGAINLLITVIEGTIRQYLIQKKGKQNSQIMRTDDLMKIFGHLENDYCQSWAGKYEGDGRQLDKGQIDKLMKLHREYIKLWMDMVRTYFGNNLYLDTRGGITCDALNRHSIIHGFDGDIYDSLSNFLKVYNTLQFLGWAFAVSDFSMPGHFSVNEETIHYKWKALEKLRLVTALTEEIKSSVYEKYPDFEKDKFLYTPPQERGIFVDRLKRRDLTPMFKLIDNTIDNKFEDIQAP